MKKTVVREFKVYLQAHYSFFGAGLKTKDVGISIVKAKDYEAAWDKAVKEINKQTSPSSEVLLSVKDIVEILQ